MLPATRLVLTVVTNTVNEPNSGFVLRFGDVDLVSGHLLLTVLVEWQHPDRKDLLRDRVRALDNKLKEFLNGTGIGVKIVVMGEDT